MRKMTSYLALGAVLAAGCLAGKMAWAADAAGEDKAAAAAPAAPKGPKTITLGIMKPVSFPHAKHAALKAYACKDCHGGETPLFPMKTAPMKMMDGHKSCTTCHNGTNGKNDKPVFKLSMADSTTCVKCHPPKDAAAK
jgi:c(7)-type cytochrome triheme protein